MIKFHHVDEPQLIYTWTVDSDGVVTIYWEQNGAPCHFTDGDVIQVDHNTILDYISHIG